MLKGRKGLTGNDCIAACLRTLTNDDNVPHLFDGRPAPVAWEGLREYLYQRGKFLLLLPVDDPWDAMATDNPSIPYMLLCRTLAGDHAVVCRDGMVVHDPSPVELPVTGPHSLGMWIAGFVGDLDR